MFAVQIYPRIMVAERSMEEVNATLGKLSDELTKFMKRVDIVENGFTQMKIDMVTYKAAISC